MSRKKDNRILGVQRDKLVVALTQDEAVAALNLAMRVRKAKLTIDFSEDVVAYLKLEMPGCPAQGIAVANPRSKFAAYEVIPNNPDLRVLWLDIKDRLAKFGAKLVFAAEKKPNEKPRAALQMHVEGARIVVLTLFDCRKGRAKVQDQFMLPDGTIP